MMIMCWRGSTTVLLLSVLLFGGALRSALGGDEGGPSNKIIGGTQASVGEYEYFIHWYDPSDGWCGGSLIHDDIMLTAAHCRIRGSVVYVGAYRFGSTSNGAQRRTIVQRSPHPCYSDPSFAFDYQVMKLDSPVTISPIEINSNSNQPENGETLTVMGMGITSESGSSGPAILREVDVPKKRDSECAQISSTFDADDMFCAGFDSGGRDSCAGDSGGPIIERLANGQHRQVGIVSWGVGCARPNLEGVYARVSSQYDWIRYQICDMTSTNRPSYCASLTEPTIECPRASGGGGGGFDCFSPAATVVVRRGRGHDDGGGIFPIRMDELRVGDSVRNKNGEFQPVYGFGHRHNERPTTYLRIETSLKGEEPLELTKKHLLYVKGRSYPIPAGQIAVGDVLESWSASSSTEEEAKVLRIGTIVRDGLYMPLTADGTIVVNGIVASTHVSLTESGRLVIAEEAGGHSSTFFPPFLRDMMTFHTLGQMWMAPLRIWCHLVSNRPCMDPRYYCDDDDDDDSDVNGDGTNAAGDGYWFWSKIGLELFRSVQGLGTFWKVLVVTPFVVVLPVASIVLEYTLTVALPTLIMAILIAAVATRAFAHAKTMKMTTKTAKTP